MTLFLLWSFFFVNENLGSENPHSGKIELKINNLRNKKGSLLICLFNQKEGFPDDSKRSYQNWKVPTSSSIVLTDIPKGQYALVIMHDEDGNNAMTYNSLRFPKEGFGVSGYQPSLLQKPDFQKAAFLHNQKLTSLSLRLRY